jgi:protoporphyrinogen oxidase
MDGAATGVTVGAMRVWYAPPHLAGEPPMPTPRRHFIRYLVAGPISAGCPLRAADDGTAAALPAGSRMAGDTFAIGHRKRDGGVFPRPSRWTSCALVIVGGGMSGLAAAYFAGNEDLVLLENEAAPGGHARSDALGGIPCSIGTAYVGRNDAAGKLAAELGLPPRAVAGWDGTVDRGVFTPDIWGGGIDALPYERRVRDQFAACRRDLLRLDPDDARHDDLALADLLAPYGPEVTRWWDAYCPSNWGARADGVAASLGIETVRWWARPDRVDTRATWPGGVGALAEKLAAVVRERHQEGIVTAATVLSVTQSGDGVEVTYFHDGAVVGVRARAAIVAVPKYMARHLLPDLPADQREAMGRITYNPYCVVNVLCARPVRRHAFDTWFPGRRFTDCIAADWVSSARGGDDAGRLLTCYVPLADGEREALLDDDRCRELASAVVADLCAAWPGEKPEPVEVHLYRRGHAIHASAPGLTRHQALARRPLGRIAFAHGDVGSLVASSSGAIRAARRAVDEIAVWR